MKISDEIRDWCDDVDYDSGKIRTTKELRVLAGLIDAKTVELPRSADGKTWTGREVCFWTDDGANHRLYALVRRDGRWYVEDTCGIRYSAESVWSERPDSWERIAYDIETVVPISDEDDERLRHELANRIRKLAAKDGER